MGLAGVDTVGATDGLQQVVILHRLVEVHHLQNRRIETGQELGGDDQELERVVRIAESVEELFLFIARHLPLRILIAFATCRMHHNSACLRSDKLIQSLLIKNAAFSVEGDDLGFEPVWLYLILVMPDDMLAYSADSSWRLD